MKGLIISSGDVKDFKLLNRIVLEHDYIVCADGGLDHLIKIDQVPDIVVGDFDSISDKGLKFIRDNKISVERFPTMKDQTDTEIALSHLLDRKVDEITLMGVTGSRIDHTMANIFLLKRLDMKGIVGRVIDDNNIVYFANSRFRIENREGYNVSVIPINDDGIIVSLVGFLYPLDKKFVKFGSTLGISNKIVEDYGDIIIHSGEALIIESID